MTPALHVVLQHLRNCRVGYVGGPTEAQCNEAADEIEAMVSTKEPAMTDTALRLLMVMAEHYTGPQAAEVRRLRAQIVMEDAGTETCHEHVSRALSARCISIFGSTWSTDAAEQLARAAIVAVRQWDAHS